jgi:hypothetical protein
MACSTHALLIRHGRPSSVTKKHLLELLRRLLSWRASKLRSPLASLRRPRQHAPTLGNCRYRLRVSAPHPSAQSIGIDDGKVLEESEVRGPLNARTIATHRSLDRSAGCWRSSYSSLRSAERRAESHAKAPPFLGRCQRVLEVQVAGGHSPIVAVDSQNLVVSHVGLISPYPASPLSVAIPPRRDKLCSVQWSMRTLDGPRDWFEVGVRPPQRDALPRVKAQSDSVRRVSV